MELLGLGLVEGGICCFGKSEKVLKLGIQSVFDGLVDFLRFELLKSSSIDLCLPFSAPLEILTGEPLTLTKTLVLLTDFFILGFCPEGFPGLTGGEAPEMRLVWWSGPERTGEARLLGGDEGVRTF